MQAGCLTKLDPVTRAIGTEAIGVSEAFLGLGWNVLTVFLSRCKNGFISLGNLSIRYRRHRSDKDEECEPHDKRITQKPTIFNLSPFSIHQAP